MTAVRRQPSSDRPDVVRLRGDLEMLYRRRYGELVGLARLLAHGTELSGSAEDVVQDVFTSIYCRDHGLDRPEELEGYVARAIVNRTRSAHRTRQRRGFTVELSEANSPEVASTYSPDRQAVLEALGQLPQRQRECAVVHYLIGMTHAEVAKALGMRDGTVKTHLRRASRALATTLEGHHRD